MSTNKKFRVQNGLDVTGEVSVGGVTVINADGTVVSDVSDQLVPLQADVAALETAVENIIGTSPETLDTLQEIVAAYEGADSDLQLLVSQTNQSVTDLENSVGAGASLITPETPMTVMVPDSEPTPVSGYIVTAPEGVIYIYDGVTRGLLHTINGTNTYGIIAAKECFFSYNQSSGLVEAWNYDGTIIGSNPSATLVSDTNNPFRYWSYSSELNKVFVSHEYNPDQVEMLDPTDPLAAPVVIHNSTMSGNELYSQAIKKVEYSSGKLMLWSWDQMAVMDWSGDPSIAPFNATLISSNMFGDSNKHRNYFSDVEIVGSNLVVSIGRQVGGWGHIGIYDLNNLSAPPIVANCNSDIEEITKYEASDGKTWIIMACYNDGGDFHAIAFDENNQIIGTPAEGYDNYYGNYYNIPTVRFVTSLANGNKMDGADVNGHIFYGYKQSYLFTFDLTQLVGMSSGSISHTGELSGGNKFMTYLTHVSPTVLAYSYSPEVIVPNSGVVPAINYLEDKTDDMQAEINALSGTDTSLTTSVAANAAAITANTAAISAEATARQAAIDAIPAPDLSSYATSASVTAGDLALQDQIDAIVGTSPATLDTLQEIVAAFESADGDLQAVMTANASTISDLDAFVKGPAPVHAELYSTSLSAYYVNNGGANFNNSVSGSTFTRGSQSYIAHQTMTGLTVGEEYTFSATTLSNSGQGQVFIFDGPTSLNSGNNPDTTKCVAIVNMFTPGTDYTKTFTATKTSMDITFSVNTFGSENALRLSGLSLKTAEAPTISLDTTATQVVPAINELHTELQTLAGLDTSIVGDVAANTQAIADEVARATAAEAALAADIATESSARSAKGNTQDTNIAANATAISNEVTRATAAEQANTDAIVVEAAARAAADSDLSASISAIASGVNTGDLTVTGSATFESGINVGSNGGSIGYDDTSEDIQMMSDVDMSGNLIHNLGTPVASTDAASKSYVDGRISSVIGGSVESLDTIKEVVDAFQNADSDIQSLITANSTSVSANTTAIAAETTRAQGVEASLQSQITAAADTSDLESDIQANAAAIAVNATNHSTLDAFVGDGASVNLVSMDAGDWIKLSNADDDGTFASNNIASNPTPNTLELTPSARFGYQTVQLSANTTYTLSFKVSGTNFQIAGEGGFNINVMKEGTPVWPANTNNFVEPGVSGFDFYNGGEGTQTYTFYNDVEQEAKIAFYLASGTGTGTWVFEDMFLGDPSEVVSLETSASTVVGAINELAVAVADTSSITAAFQAADSDVTAAFQAADASLQAQIDAGSFDGSAIDQNLVPSVTDTYSLGTPDKVWKDLYIGPGSLYLNGTKILEDNSGTITMYADAGQNLSFGASGGGSIDLNAGSESIQIKSDLVLSVGETISTVGGAATRFGGSVNMQTHKIENVGAPTADLDVVTKLYVDTLVAAGTVSGDRTFDANVVVEGNLTVSGTTTTVNSETISLADNIIDLNSNLTSGAPSEHAGIRVLRGDESAVQVRWNETSDHWEVYNGSAWTKIALNTDDLAEGSTNQYFTEVRARGCVSADDYSCIDYDETTGKFSLDVAETEAAITPDSAKDADKLDGQHGSYYRINVYDANGALVN